MQLRVLLNRKGNTHSEICEIIWSIFKRVLHQLYSWRKKDGKNEKCFCRAKCVYIVYNLSVQTQTHAVESNDLFQMLRKSNFLAYILMGICLFMYKCVDFAIRNSNSETRFLAFGINAILRNRIVCGGNGRGNQMCVAQIYRSKNSINV